MRRDSDKPAMINYATSPKSIPPLFSKGAAPYMSLDESGSYHYSSSKNDDVHADYFPPPCSLLSERKLSPRTVQQIRRSESIMIYANAIEGCDQQLFPATFKALETDLGLTPTALGNVLLAHHLCLSLSCPVWGYLSDFYSRKYIVGFACISWGILTMLIVYTKLYWQILVLRAMCGLAIGSMGPVTHSILANMIGQKKRGVAFGFVQFAHCLGRIVAGVPATSISAMTFMGMAGWRWAFGIVGIFSIIFGFLIFCVRWIDNIPFPSRIVSTRPSDEICRLKDGVVVGDTGGGNYFQQLSNTDVGNSFSYNFTTFFRHAIVEFSTPTVILLAVEGAFVLIPWSALSFLTMYLQYCGLNDLQAAMVQGLLLVGCTFAGLLGGFLGDRSFSVSPDYGRVSIGFVSILMRMPCILAIFYALPKSPTSFPMFCVLSFILGLFMLTGAAVNRPILADVVKPSHCGTVFATVSAIEGTSAALFGAPLVGILSEHVFGYQKTDLRIKHMSESMRIANVKSLEVSLTILTIAPWCASLLLYVLMFKWYGRDRRRLNAWWWKGAEQLLDTERTRRNNTNGNSSSSHFSTTLYGATDKAGNQDWSNQ